MTKNASIAVLIVAAGRGARAGGETPKQYRPIAGAPLLAHTVARFAAAELSRVVCAVRTEDADLFADVASRAAPKIEMVPGGDSRAASVQAGLRHLAAAPPDVVLIHDGARPLTASEDIKAVIAALDAHDGAVLGRPMSDTVKRAGGDRRIGETVPRADLWRAETPQAFRFGKIMEAYEAAAAADALDAATDDASVAERAGLSVVLVPATGTNLKVTHPEDFALAKALLKKGQTMEYRTGQGVDAHAFAPGDHVALCGVKIPHDRGLAGHSDADVALHALTDALLGAAGAGDIGAHFPPSDPQWKGAASSIFVEKAVALIGEKGGAVVNADITIICEAPRIGPHKAAMEETVASILNIAASRVNVKATTMEKMGFTGRKEGIAAMAAVSVRLPAEDTP
ncbi:MAG: bifunctional 2-C-methyl-D-erythritol 4-phosphate cytidylyltransferase/2-C-methyl-D-erythritol 2,4-cyclodiphosphate synthase [Pseudomonadota bacterium]